MQRELKAVGLFCLIAFSVSWGLVGAMYLSGALSSPIPRALASLLFPLGPLLAAAGAHYWYYRRFDLEELGLKLLLSHWVLIAWATPAIIAVLSLLFSKFLPGVTWSFDPAAHPLPADATEEMRKQYEAVKSAPQVLTVVAPFVMTVFFGTLVNLVPRLAEELGWRGVLLRLLKGFGFWRASVLIGVLAGIWAMPLVLLGDYYAKNTRGGLAMMLVFMVLVSILASYFRLQAGTVLAAAVFSAALTAMIRFVQLPYVEGSDLLYGITGAAGLIALGLAIAFLVVPHSRDADAELRQ